jgi:hypothetical protein
MNINHRNFILVLLFVSGSGCKGHDAATTNPAKTGNNDLVCAAHGGFEERVCKTSILRIIVDAPSLNGKTIATQGFLADVDGRIYLFPTEEFAATKDLSNAVACEEDGGDLASSVGDYVTVFGKFSSLRPKSGGFTVAAGTILVSKIRHSAHGSE